jgi:hypothetical protein
MRPHLNYLRDYDPATGRYVESDPIGLGQALTRMRTQKMTRRWSLTSLVSTLRCVPESSMAFLSELVRSSTNMSCVGNAKTGYTCKGLGPSGVNPFNTPGKIESDSYKPSACSVIQPDNKCVEDCIKKKFGGPLPNYSVDLSQGENCQTYSTGIVSECFAQCHAKPSSTAGGSK